MDAHPAKNFAATACQCANQRDAGNAVITHAMAKDMVLCHSNFPARLYVPFACS